MRHFISILLLTFGISVPSVSANTLPKERMENIRLQIFLDQQHFGPGILDGKLGTYTTMAMEAYNQKLGRELKDWDAVKADALREVPHIFAIATVPEVARDFVDSSLPGEKERSEQSKRKSMPYRTVSEFIAERYHTTEELLERINGKEVMKNLKIRSPLRVPNVAPFQIEELGQGRTHRKDPNLSKRWVVIDTSKHQLRIFEARTFPKAILAPDNEGEISVETETKVGETVTPEIPRTVPKAIPIDSTRDGAMTDNDDKEEQIDPRYDETKAKLIAAFPITPGKPQFIRRGTWKMTNAIEFPSWRYDKSLLETGQRSTQSLSIPSGPNNPVGVLWMGLSRKGIGIHGTDKPHTIGRARSSGCIRLSNWDVVHVPKYVRPGATVIIK